MDVLLTLTVQTTIEAENEEDYEKQRDAIVASIEAEGLTVDITSEDSDDFYGE